MCDKCCFCFTIELGAKVIGFLNFIAIFESIINFEPMALGLRFCACVTFSLLLANNTKARRLYYCVSYLMMALGQLALEIVILFDPIFIKKREQELSKFCDQYVIHEYD